MRRFAPILAIIAASYAYFVSGPAWNQNSRFALVRAIVERGSLAIDPDHETTGDKSWRDGHYYSDKAPAASWLAVPPYAVMYGLRRATGREVPGVGVHPLDPKQQVDGEVIAIEDRKPGDRLVYNQAFRVGLYVCTAFAVTLPSCIAIALLVLAVTRRQGLGPRDAATVGLVYALATPAFTYSTAFYGHQLCAAALISAFALTWLPAPGQLGRAPAFGVGLVLGLAVASEYPSAPVVLALFVHAVARHGVRPAIAIACGGVPWIVALALYHTAAFGHPLATGYDFVHHPEFARGMAVAYGFGRPDLHALLELTFGSYRGLFYLSPVLLLAVWGLAVDVVRRRDPAAVLASLVVAYELLLSASYYMWDGGASAGPRHAVPALPFLALGLRTAWTRVPGLFTVLAIVSALQILLLTAAGPEAAQHGNPLWEFAIDRLLRQDPEATMQRTNVGALLGLSGPFSLVPLLGLWLLAVEPWRRLG